MDSDTEDYISEKLNQHRESGSSFDRLKGSGNLQICFMNEAAKDQDFGTSEEEPAPDRNKVTVAAVNVPKPPMHLSSSVLGKCDKVIDTFNFYKTLVNICFEILSVFLNDYKSIY